MTDIQTALNLATHQLAQTSDSAQLDAEVLLGHVLAKPRTFLRAWPESQLVEDQETHYLEMVAKRAKGSPIAYLTQKKEFWSRDFLVTTDVLIPRPDTELLVELSLLSLNHQERAKVIDLGTGTGIIAITLAAECPQIEVTAVDACNKALTVARQNADRYHLNNIKFAQSNWFDQFQQSQFDLIISNPPYISADDPHLSQGDVRFEPNSALIAKDKGLADLQTIIAQAKNHLNSHGKVFLEHGYNQENQVKNLFNSFGYQNITTYNDLAGNPRVTTGQWIPS